MTEKNPQNKCIHTCTLYIRFHYSSRSCVFIYVGSMTPDLHGDKARPGKDRKGNIYDVQRSSNDGNGQQKKTAVSKDDSFRSIL